MSTPTLYVRTAVPDDLDTLVRWREDAAKWISAEHGSTQWSNPGNTARMLAWINEGSTFMASLAPGGEAVATITSTPHGDRRCGPRRSCARPRATCTCST